MRSLCERVRRRYCIPLPVEVRYDEFTRDVLVNRLLKAAAHRLVRLRLGSQRARSAVAWAAESLRNVSLAAFPANSVPEVNFDRPNEEYRGAATLAKLVLRSAMRARWEAGSSAFRWSASQPRVRMELPARLRHDPSAAKARSPAAPTTNTSAGPPWSGKRQLPRRGRSTRPVSTTVAVQGDTNGGRNGVAGGSARAKRYCSTT